MTNLFHHLKKTKYKRCFYILFYVFLYLLFSNGCKSFQINKLNLPNNNGTLKNFSCGEIDSINGQIIIVVALDSITYFRVNIYRSNTLIDSGYFFIHDNLELLDFSVHKRQRYGYLWDCSDVGSTLDHPDTISCKQCNVKVNVKHGKSMNLGVSRIYQIEVIDGRFPKRNINNFISGSIKFNSRWGFNMAEPN